MKKKKKGDSPENLDKDLISGDAPDDFEDAPEVQTEPEVVNETTPESEDAARPVEPKPKQMPVSVHEDKPLVKLAVFLKVAGPRWDQMAGFKQYAKRNQLGPMSIPEWRVELQKFMSKPTG